MRKITLLALFCSMALTSLTGQDYNSGAGSTGAAVLKHPVAVVAVPAGGSSMQIPAFIEKLEIWKNMKTEEGVALPVEEWATTLDLLKEKLADSNVIRVMELPAADMIKSRIAMPDYLLMAKFGTTPDGGKRIFLRLADPCSGAVLSSSSASGGKFEEAIAKAMKNIENDAAMCAWRCRVSEVSGTTMIINRGRIDGVRNGDTFQGWKITADKDAATSAMPDELVLMKYGKKTGQYKVIEEGKLFSKVEPVGDAQVLATGDVLEQPEIWLKDKKRESRAKRVWDKIYDKKNNN
jgi:hypothetical protein